MDKLQLVEQELAYWNTERLKLLHPLRQLFWECTLNCNLSCLHCGSDCTKDSFKKEMPLDDFLPVLDEIKKHQPKTKTIVFTVGGEPLLRKDLVECGKAITGKGFYWGLVTNGHLLDKNMMVSLSNAGLRSLSIDLDGLEREHNWLRNNDYSFDRVYNAIQYIKEAPCLSWDVITCVNNRNIDCLDELKSMLIEAGGSRWRLFTIVPMGRAKNNPDLLLADGNFRKLMDFIVQTRKEGRIKLSYACEGYLGNYEGLVRDYHFSCRSGLTVASIRSNGDISGCLSIRNDYNQGNIYTDSFWDVWNNRFELYRNREWKQEGICDSCDAFKFCQGNGMHLRDENGHLMRCHYQILK